MTNKMAVTKLNINWSDKAVSLLDLLQAREGGASRLRARVVHVNRQQQQLYLKKKHHSFTRSRSKMI